MNRAEAGKPAAQRIADAWKRLAPTFGPLGPHHITEGLCRQYIAERRQVASDGTIHVELGYLRSAMRFARVRRQWITVEPYIPLPQKPPPKDHHLTRDEARRLVAACSAFHIRLFVVLALSTAARVGALLDLTWDRVDFVRRKIVLANPERAATPKGRAIVPMNDMAFQALEEAHQAAITGHVIEWAGKRVASIKKGVARASDRAGLDASPHVLRHTAAVWMAEAGVPMEEISQYLGHRDVATTRRIYARFSPDYLRHAARALEL
jgi:integrase